MPRGFVFENLENSKDGFAFYGEKYLSKGSSAGSRPLCSLPRFVSKQLKQNKFCSVGTVCLRDMQGESNFKKSRCGKIFWGLMAWGFPYCKVSVGMSRKGKKRQPLRLSLLS
jgi:hypothetical protein